MLDSGESSVAYSPLSMRSCSCCFSIRDSSSMDGPVMTGLRVVNARKKTRNWQLLALLPVVRNNT